MVLLFTGDVRPLKRPPNWLKRPVSVSFGFGGRLASLTNHKQQMQDPMTGQVGEVAWPLPSACVLHTGVFSVCGTRRVGSQAVAAAPDVQQSPTELPANISVCLA